MPRSSRSSGRPTASKPASHPTPSTQRSAHTQAAPPPHAQQQQHYPPQTAAPVPQAAPGGGSGGFLSNVVGTAAGVGMGSVIGHGVSNMLFGGRSSEPAPVEQQPAQAVQQQEGAKMSCDVQAKDFTRCLEATNDMQSCSYYLEQLKACQAAASAFTH